MKKFELNLDLCIKLAEGIQAIQDELGVHISMAITDEHGSLVFYHRFKNAILPSIEISQKKAYTAAVLRQPTKEFGKIAQVDGDAFGINITHPKLVIFGGGFPLNVDGITIGGLGISGGSVEEDEKIAAAALNIFADLTKQTTLYMDNIKIDDSKPGKESA